LVFISVLVRKGVSQIISRAERNGGEPDILKADPDMFKLFWHEVRGNYFFRNRRVYMDFLKSGDGKIFYLPQESLIVPPFALVGNWRDRRDITALWHVKGIGAIKRVLVVGAARECFKEGAEKMISKLLTEYEAAEFRQWGFEKACRIILLEKRLTSQPATPAEPAGIRLSRFKKSMLKKVLQVDAESFDDFWKLDDRTLEAIAESCRRNVFLVATRGSDVIGYAIAGANGPLGYLQRLGVHRDYQGHGIGRFLACIVLKTLYFMGANVVMVNTQEENLVAMELYKSLGFGELPETRYIMQCEAADCGRTL
jgi:ribosomal protein S18 acetylase RimI-like enzyme